jgi:hypothetical protein
MENATKVSIHIAAGVMVGEPTLTKEITITSEQWYNSRDDEMLKAYGFAVEYMRALWQPQMFNWVTCTWIYL